MRFQSIPIIRIFDEEKAKEFYLGYLGMKLDWEHRFEEGYPIYMQVSRDNLVFHLSEHSGDCTPGSKVFVNTSDLEKLHQEITSKAYKYYHPEITTAPWGDRMFEVTDPFSNKVLFNEQSNTYKWVKSRPAAAGTSKSCAFRRPLPDRYRPAERNS